MVSFKHCSKNNYQTQMPTNNMHGMRSSKVSQFTAQFSRCISNPVDCPLGSLSLLARMSLRMQQLKNHWEGSSYNLHIRELYKKLFQFSLCLICLTLLCDDMCAFLLNISANRKMFWTTVLKKGWNMFYAKHTFPTNLVVFRDN